MFALPLRKRTFLRVYQYTPDASNRWFCAILAVPQPLTRRRPAGRTIMALHRTSLRVGFGLALSVCLAPAPGHAQTKYPDRSVKLLIGFTAGGGTDVAGRVIAQKLSEATGQTFVVENRPGASGLIASEAVARATADGTTIMVGSQTTLAVAPALYKKFQLDATKELTGLAMLGISPLVAVVNADSPI